MEWFIGVVEDRNDPEQMGRVRVRVVGIHSENLNEIPTSSLPWATVMTPTTSASISGVMQTPHLVEGTWVVGFFHDGKLKQDPIIMGSIPGKPIEKRSNKFGFADPSSQYPKYTNESDLPFEARLERYKESTTYSLKNAQNVRFVPTATRPKIESVSAPKADTEYQLKLWSEFEPLNNHKPAYPYNHVRKSETGIVEEIDDTPGFSRYSLLHPSGTYEEVYNDGSRALHVEGYQKIFIKKGCDIYVSGDTNVTVNGNMTHYVIGDYKLEVTGDYTRQIHGSMQTKVGKNDEREIMMNRSINIGENDKLTVGIDKVTSVGQDYKNTIGRDLNFYTVRNHDNTVLGNLTELVFANYGQTNLGTLTMTSKGNVKVETPSNYTETITGNQTTTIGGTKTETAPTGNVTYGIESDVIAAGISLVTHTHGLSTDSDLSTTDNTDAPNASE